MLTQTKQSKLSVNLNQNYVGQIKPNRAAVFTRVMASVFLSACLLGYSYWTYADLEVVPDSELTMNKELREDIYQTLYRLRFEHYTRNDLNDDYSARTLDGFLKLLDPNKLYFSRKDITEFDKFRFEIDDLLKKRDAELGFQIFKVFRQRLDERAKKLTQLIQHDFDFSVEEAIKIDRDDYIWAADQSALDERWRKRIKNDTLQQLMAETELPTIRENLTRRYQRQRDIIFQLKADEVFEWFLNAYAREVGPHTQYMSDSTAENFRISMSLSLEGIGAALQSKDDYTVINRILPGGPAEKDGRLGAEDKIIAVGQENEDMINVIGWRLTDVVKMIRGDKGTRVLLDYEPEGAVPGSPPERIELTRDIIHLEDQAAKLSTVTLDNSTHTSKFSVISIPSFYTNTRNVKGGEDVVSVALDVEKLLNQIKGSDSQGLIIDLRGNGGGDLSEAIRLTGLFIPPGPVVQVVQQNGKRSVLRNNQKGVTYDGPLMVLIDRYSASASEIFAAAMQDYGRAIIVGERSFGKGTVQHLVSLRRGKNIDHESRVKFTIAQFFRVNGGSTQHKGVIPDIHLNYRVEDDEFGERAYDNALPWSQTNAATFNASQFSTTMINKLKQQHLVRSQESPAFTLLRQVSNQAKENKNTKKLSLNLSERQTKRNSAERKSLDQLNTYRKSLGLDPVTADTRADNPLPNEDEHWNIVIQEEAARILHDQLSWSDSILTKQNQLKSNAQ